MANKNRKTEKQTTRGSNRLALAAKKIQAIDAARVQKKKPTVHMVSGGNVVVANGHNTHSPPSRRSNRLNRITAVVTSPVSGGRGHTGNVDAQMASAQSRAEGSLDEVQDLQQQLQEEREKNRLLRRAAEKQTSHTQKKITKPKGSIGTAGFSLIAAMKLDRDNPKDKVLYNDILASVRALAISAGIDLGHRYKDQSITKLSKLMLAAREAEPYLAIFEDDWATGQILRQYINGKRKYENAKASGKVTVRAERHRMAFRGPIVQLPSDNDEVEDGSGNGFGNEGEDEDEWLGITRFDGVDHDQMDTETGSLDDI